MQALPTLIQMLRSDDVGIHYEAVGVIGNLVHSSQHIKKTVLDVRLHALIGSLPEQTLCIVASCFAHSNRRSCKSRVLFWDHARPHDTAHRQQAAGRKIADPWHHPDESP